MLCVSGFELYSRWVPLLKKQGRGLGKRHLKSEFALLPTLIDAYSVSFNSSNSGVVFLKTVSKFRKRKRKLLSCVLVLQKT